MKSWLTLSTCRVVPNKSTLPVLTNVLLEADPAGGLRVVATNLELTSPGASSGRP